jgi:hypothetical protein
MFTWICPQCGREIPPSESECPDCSDRSRARSPNAQSAAAPPAEAAGALRRPPKPGVSREGLPAWLLALLFALGFAALGVGGFYAYRHFSSAGQAPSPAARLAPASPAPAEAPAALSPSLILENLEVTGLRLIENGQKKLEVQFLLVNHSPASLTDIAGTVTLRPSTAKPGSERVGAFAFRLPSLGPYESRDLRAPVETKMRVYELPDWQFLRADVAITSPLLPR